MTNTNLPYSFDAQDVEDQIAYGNGSVQVRFNVIGYWSDVVTVRINRQHDWRAAFEERAEVVEWTADVSHSSGGRDLEQVASDIEAERNFGAAVLAACDLAEALLARKDELEAAYQARRAADEAAREKAEQEEAERVAADPAIGEPAAKALIEKLIADARNTEHASEEIELSARLRGRDEDYRRVTAQRNWERRVQLYFNGSVISRKDAIAKVAELARKGAAIGPKAR